MSAKLRKNQTLKSYKNFPHGMPTMQFAAVAAVAISVLLYPIHELAFALQRHAGTALRLQRPQSKNRRHDPTSRTSVKPPNAAAEAVTTNARRERLSAVSSMYSVLQFNVSRIAMSNGPLHRANRRGNFTKWRGPTPHSERTDFAEGVPTRHTPAAESDHNSGGGKSCKNNWNRAGVPPWCASNSAEGTIFRNWARRRTKRCFQRYVGSTLQERTRPIRPRISGFGLMEIQALARMERQPLHPNL